MPSQQRFEGPVLEELIEDVRRRFGPEVDIVEANKIRSGGVGGFFARELFELVVEVDDVDSEPDPTGTAPARSLLDLVDAVDDGPAPAHLRADAEPGRRDTMASEDTIQALLAKTADAPLPDDTPGRDHDRSRDDQVAQLLRRLSAPAPTAPADQGTTVSTDGEAFADVLERISRSAQPAAQPSAQVVDDEPFRSFADTARRSPATPGPSMVQPSAAPTEARPAVAEPDVDVPAAVTSTNAARPARGMRRREPVDDGLDLDCGGLVRLGLPPELVAGRSIAARDRLGTLIEIAESLPRAGRLPDAPNTVIALVGDRMGMQHAIEWIQESLCLSPERLMLATRTDEGVFPLERRITSHEDAAGHRRSWRRRRRPVLVAVDSPVGLAGASWARHVLDALEPHAVWGVVDASRKPEDLVEWSERIGGVDALAVHGTANTASPASVLTTGLPVSLVDGSAASPARWAAILDERLAA